MTDALPPLRIEDDGDRYCVVDELVLGFIEARSDVHSGEPCIAGTRMTANTAWLWLFRDDPDTEMRNGVSRDQILVAEGFRAGRNWQRSRKRRQRMEDEVASHWKRIRERQKGDYIPGDEVV